MHERILQRFRDRIRSLDYVVTLHAEEEMDEDGLSVFDLESAVLTGEIVERQRDRQTREWKYVVTAEASMAARSVSLESRALPVVSL